MLKSVVTYVDWISWRYLPACDNICSALQQDVEWLQCQVSDCHCWFHITCLAACFLETDSQDTDALVPTEGRCPACKHIITWGDWVRQHLVLQLNSKDTD